MASTFSRRNSRWYTFVFLLVTGTICLQAVAQTDKNKDTPLKSKYGVNQPLGDAYVPVRSVDEAQTRLVIYRAPIQSKQSADNGGVISIYLNDRYHTSLQSESFTFICLNGKHADVRARYIASQKEDVLPELDTRYTVDMKGGQSVYLRVAVEKSQKTLIEVVTPAVAGTDLTKARMQMHTLSRVLGAERCKEAEERRKPFDANVITFGSDTVFEHQKTGIDGITQQGKQELQQIIQKINVKYKTFNDVKVHVVGYADDEKNEELNQRISKERAKSVGTYFEHQGLRATEITFEGRGSQDKSRAESSGFLPRRVEVDVAVDLH